MGSTENAVCLEKRRAAFSVFFGRACDCPCRWKGGLVCPGRFRRAYPPLPEGKDKKIRICAIFFMNPVEKEEEASFSLNMEKGRSVAERGETI